MTVLRGEVYGRSLTVQEYAVLAAYARTGSSKDAATALGIAVSTAKNHLAAVRQKLGVETTIEALAAAGWLRIPEPGDEPDLCATATALALVEALRRAADDLESAL